MRKKCNGSNNSIRQKTIVSSANYLHCLSPAILTPKCHRQLIPSPKKTDHLKCQRWVGKVRGGSQSQPAPVPSAAAAAASAQLDCNISRSRRLLHFPSRLLTRARIISSLWKVCSLFHLRTTNIFQSGIASPSRLFSCILSFAPHTLASSFTQLKVCFSFVN